VQFFQSSVFSAFDEGLGSQYTVILQYVLLSFIYFLKVEIAEFLRSFLSKYIQFELNNW